MRSLTRFDAGDASDHFTSYQLDGSIEHYRGGDGNRELGFGSVERALETALTSKLDMATLLLGLLFVRGRIGFGLRPGLRNLGLCLKCACLSWTSI
jgi:hypothetical protein